MKNQIIFLLVLVAPLLKFSDAQALPEKGPLVGKGRFVSFIPVTPDGKTYAIWDEDKKTVKICDTRTGAIRHLLKGHSERVDEILFAPDNKTLITWSHTGEAILWDTRTGTPKQTLKAKVRSHYWYPVTFSPDGKMFAIGSFYTGADNETAAQGVGLVTLWDARTGKRKGVITTGRDYRVEAVEFLPDGQTLMTRGSWSKASFWDLRSGQLKTEMRLPAYGLALSPDGKTAALEGFSPATFGGLGSTTFGGLASDNDKATAPTGSPVELREVGTNTLKHKLIGHAYRVYRFRFSPDSRTLVTIGDKTEIVGDMGLPKFELKAWNVQTGKLLWELGEKESASDILWSPDSKTLLTVDYRLLDAITGQVKQTLQRDFRRARRHGVMFSPGGDLVTIKAPEAKQ